MIRGNGKVCLSSTVRNPRASWRKDSRLPCNILAFLLSFADCVRNWFPRHQSLKWYTREEVLEKKQDASSRIFANEKFLFKYLWTRQKLSPLREILFARIMPPRETRCVCSNAWWRYNFFSLSFFFPSKWISFAREFGFYLLWYLLFFHGLE